MMMKCFSTRVFYLGILGLLFGVMQCQTLLKNGQNFSFHPKTITTDNEVAKSRQYWLSADKGLKKFMSKLMKMAMPTILREVYSRNISSECMSSLLQLSTALKKAKLWAFQMIDANGKLPEGFLNGGLTVLGAYTECVDIFVTDEKRNLQGQYCTAQISPPLPEWRPFSSIHLRSPELVNVSAPDTVITYLSHVLHNLHTVRIKLGLCVPSLCKKQDLQNLIQILAEQIGNWKFDIQRCEVKQTLSFTTAQIAILYVFGILAFLLICGSLADIIWKVDDFPPNDIKAKVLHYLLAFSMFSNTRKLASYKCPHNNLSFVHGIMFICILWIIISNTFMCLNYHIATNFISAIQIIKILVFEIALNRSIPAQTFFFLNGLIATYKWMKTPEEDISIWKYLLKRYLRYTPTYILIIGLSMLTLTLGSGPSWLDYVTPIYDKCYNNWWANIFYINNFFDPGKACLSHTWILAVDAQLHLFGLLILIPLKRRPNIGLILNFVLLAASLLTVALTHVYYDVPPAEMLAFLSDKDKSFFASHTYYRIYTHLCMYCTGIAVGYFLSEKQKISTSKWFVAIGWIVTITAGLSVLCAMDVWRTGMLPMPLVGAVYATFGKVAWAALLAWVTVNCATGNGGGLNDLLSWKPLAFLARLAFLAYILHYLIIDLTMANKKSHLYVDQFEFCFNVMSYITSIHVLAFICFLSFEAPFLSLADAIRKRHQSSVYGLSDNLGVNPNQACNGVMTEKPMKYEEKLKQVEKLREISRTKC